MLKIRLQKTGRKNSPSFRVVLTESKRGPKGKHIELLGFYNSRLNQIKIDKEKINYWISQGAKVSDTVHNLLVNQGVIKGPKKDKVGKMKKEAPKESSVPKENKPEEARKEEILEEETPQKNTQKEEAPKEESREEADEGSEKQELQGTTDEKGSKDKQEPQGATDGEEGSKEKQELQGTVEGLT